MLFMSGDIDGAMTEFTKADQLSAGNTTVKITSVLVYSRKGDRANAAMMYAAAAAGAGPEVNQNHGYPWYPQW